MDDCGISGDVRIAGGVPFRLTPNRSDTSWAERYCVQGAPPLQHTFDQPWPIEGPWPVTGWLLSHLSSGTWRVRFGPALPNAGHSLAVRTFNDGLLLLADRVQRMHDPEAPAAGPAAHRVRSRRDPATRRNAAAGSGDRFRRSVDSNSSRSSHQ